MYGYTLGLAALGEGEQYEAADKLQQAWNLALRQRIHNPTVFPMAGDLAEVWHALENWTAVHKSSPGWRSEAKPRGCPTRAPSLAVR
jgi:hypothetical protein